MPPHSPTKKLYCYVDESGQDTAGDLFVVALVVTDEERDRLAVEARRIEQESGKNSKKWWRAVFSRKVAYIKAVLSYPVFADSLFFASYEHTNVYPESTDKQ